MGNFKVLSMCGMGGGKEMKRWAINAAIEAAKVDKRRKHNCKHWDNSEAPEEFCLLYCRQCNGPCGAWEPEHV